jgi:methyl-accepting chemotaxis protein
MDRRAGIVAESARLAASIAAAMEEQQATVARVEERIGTLTRIGQASTTAAEELTVTMVDLSRLAAETRAAVEGVALARGGAA